MNEIKSSFPVVSLIGDIEENFYQLGLLDRPYQKKMLDHNKGFIRTPNKLVNFSFEKIIKLAVEPILLRNKDFAFESLRKIYFFEKRIPAFLLKKFASLYIKPRMDMLDIIYLHAKI